MIRDLCIAMEPDCHFKIKAIRKFNRVKINVNYLKIIWFKIDPRTFMQGLKNYYTLYVNFTVSWTIMPSFT